MEWGRGIGCELNRLIDLIDSVRNTASILFSNIRGLEFIVENFLVFCLFGFLIF